MTGSAPTDHPEVNALLARLLEAAQAILGSNFTGLYLHGSLALGDFCPQTSDIDFLVVTSSQLLPDTVSSLSAMHSQFAADPTKWGWELEGSYIPKGALRRYDRRDARHPHIERGGHLQVEQHDEDWVVQRHVVREYGITLRGPAPNTLIDPVSPPDLRSAVLALLRNWWARQLVDTTRLRHPGYQAYAVLTMCRVLYTLDHGDIVTKPAAARWAESGHDSRWTPLIERALKRTLSQETLGESKAFIQYTLTWSQTLHP